MGRRSKGQGEGKGTASNLPCGLLNKGHSGRGCQTGDLIDIPFTFQKKGSQQITTELGPREKRVRLRHRQAQLGERAEQHDKGNKRV